MSESRLLRGPGTAGWGGRDGAVTPGGSEIPRASQTRISRTPDFGSACCDEEADGTGEDDWDEGDDEDGCKGCDDVSLFSINNPVNNRPPFYSGPMLACLLFVPGSFQEFMVSMWKRKRWRKDKLPYEPRKWTSLFLAPRFTKLGFLTPPQGSIMDAKLASRLELLADNTLSIVFERNRLKDLKYAHRTFR